MIECSVCHGMCDPGEIVGGVCDECRDAQEQAENRSRDMARAINSPYEQITMDFTDRRMVYGLCKSAI